MNRTAEMSVRYAAFILGLIFLTLALFGFVPGITAFAADGAHVDGFGRILGIFPTNYFHNAIGILVGLWGIAAATSVGGSITFLQIFTLVYAAQAILGLLPFANTLFGTMPLYGNNVWLSAIAAAAAYYYGYVKTRDISGFSASL